MTVSVVVPTWNEASTIVESLRRLATQTADDIVVADANSPDGTAALALPYCNRVVQSARGRGVQQNQGASAATGDVLVFLHADCYLGDGALDYLRKFLIQSPLVPGGCFRMRVDDPNPGFRAIDAAAHIRAGVLGVPYGDQGIFVRRHVFDSIGGFPEVPLMDDVFLALQLRQVGRLALLPPLIHVSPRRWHARGLTRQTLQNWWL
ncbi:MAG: TIGR04283 family arsenosugar biosynthesis glycosyltransferase, partial [Isosphaeraceae bacterium]